MSDCLATNHKELPNELSLIHISWCPCDSNICGEGRGHRGVDSACDTYSEISRSCLLYTSYIGGGELAQEQKNLSKRISSVQDVTLKSKGDKATSDNKSLLDIKSEFTPLQATYEQSKETFEKKKKELESQKNKVSEKKAEADKLKEQYYESIGGAGAQEQLEYTEAQADLSLSLIHIFNETCMN